MMKQFTDTNDRNEPHARGAQAGGVTDGDLPAHGERDPGSHRPRISDVPVESSGAGVGAADSSLNPYLAAAEELIHRGNLAGALGELGRALDEHPDDVLILCARAGVYLNQQRLEPAEADLRRASKLDPGNPEVLFGLGTLFSKKARWREAIEPLQRVVELDPMRASGHYYLGEAYNQTDQLKAALGAYEAAVRLEPDNWRALKGVGIVLDKMGRPAEATAAYQKAREAQRR